MLSLIVSVGVSAEMRPQRTVLWDTQEPVYSNWNEDVTVSAENCAKLQSGDKLIVVVTSVNQTYNEQHEKTNWPRVMLASKDRNNNWKYIEYNSEGQVVYVNEACEAEFSLTDEQINQFKDTGFFLRNEGTYIGKIYIERLVEVTPRFPHVTLDGTQGISISSLASYPDDATVTVVLNHVANKNGWGIAAIYDWKGNQTHTFSATSNETSSTFVFTMSEFRAFAGESDGFGLNMWNVNNEGLTTVERITLSLNQITIPLTSAGIGSMILPFAADVPEGMTVYEVGSYEEGTLRLKSVENIVANTPYIIKGEEDSYKFVGVADAENFQYTVGNLCGTYEDITAPQDSYVLQKHEGEDAGFYRVSDTQPTVKAYRAYLTGLPEGGNSCLRLVFDDETTSVLSVSAATPATYASYNLAGQRAHKGQKGIVIADGKKYIAK